MEGCYWMPSRWLHACSKPSLIANRAVSRFPLTWSVLLPRTGGTSLDARNMHSLANYQSAPRPPPSVLPAFLKLLATVPVTNSAPHAKLATIIFASFDLGLGPEKLMLTPHAIILGETLQRSVDRMAAYFAALPPGDARCLSPSPFQIVNFASGADICTTVYRLPNRLDADEKVLPSLGN